jgi:hypothetical protein
MEEAKIIENDIVPSEACLTRLAVYTKGSKFEDVIVAFAKKVDEIWETLLTKHEVNHPCLLPKDIYETTCKELGHEQLDIFRSILVAIPSEDKTGFAKILNSSEAKLAGAFVDTWMYWKMLKI